MMEIKLVMIINVDVCVVGKYFNGSLYSSQIIIMSIDITIDTNNTII